MKKKELGIILSLMLMSVTSVALAAPAIQPIGEGVPTNHINAQKQEVQIENEVEEEKSQIEVDFKVSKIIVKSEKLPFTEAEYNNLTKSYLNKKLTINDLNSLAFSLTKYIRNNGYVAATAYVPEQRIKNGGTFVIEVLPGISGKIILDNKSKLKNDQAEMLIDRLKSGRIIKTENLESVLYSINDLGGIGATAILSPGEEIGSSDITVKIIDGKANNTVVYSENYGSKSAGRYRYGVMSTFYNLTGKADNLTVAGLISNQRQHNYSLNYSRAVGKIGSTLGIGISRMDYELGNGFEALGATGIAETYSFYGKTPLVKKANRRLDLNYGYDYRKLDDDLDAYDLDGKKHSSTFNLGLNGSYRKGKGATSYSATAYLGNLGLDSTYSRLLNEVSHVEGNFTKGVFNLNHLQTFDSRWDLLTKATYQLASHNLDSSEQLFLGGANGVRAYPQGEGSGDEGWQASTELRYHTGLKGLVLSTYFDAGHVKGNNEGTAFDETLKGWGLGVAYSSENNYFMRFDYARRIGLDENVSSDADAKSRMWFIVGKQF